MENRVREQGDLVNLVLGQIIVSYTKVVAVV
jgi:hypothetical protein